MSPHLKGLDVDAIVSRLRAAGDGEAADALARLRDAIAAQDEALRDLVSDARSIEETVDEGGSLVDIACAPDGFDALATAFGYPAVNAFDPAALARAQALPGGAEMYDGDVHLTPLEHLSARSLTEGLDQAELDRLGFVRIEIGRGQDREVIHHDPAPSRAAATSPGPAR